MQARISSFFRSQLRPHRPPLGSGLGLLEISGAQQNRELVREELAGLLARVDRPETKATLRDPLLTKPESLPVIDEWTFADSDRGVGGLGRTGQGVDQDAYCFPHVPLRSGPGGNRATP